MNFAASNRIGTGSFGIDVKLLMAIQIEKILKYQNPPFHKYEAALLIFYRFQQSRRIDGFVLKSQSNQGHFCQKTIEILEISVAEVRTGYQGIKGNRLCLRRSLNRIARLALAAFALV